MDAWIDIRRKARACHAAALIKSKGDRRGQAIVSAALENDGLELRCYEPGTLYSEGVLGSLDRESKLINVAKHQAPADELAVIAHEIGHFHLHHDPTNEVTVRPPSLGGDPIESGAGKVEGYSPRERKEVQADIFAGEFLCPADWLRAEYISSGRKPSQIATDLGLPPRLVLNQAIRALLLPPLRPPLAVTPAVAIKLDDSQKKAVIWSEGPLLVDAGPGTGKTRTLVQRIKHLLDNSATSGSILALTFSKKAAEEMRERLSMLNPNAAIEMWVGTFHAFGFELITKWPSAVGRSGKVRILDEAGSLALLEDNLAKLPLNYYQNLYEPAYELVYVLRAISRCKDELISPAVYKSAAEQALAAASAAGDADGQESAEKALEVAAIFQIYEDLLRETDSIDFGDLVLRATQLIESNSDAQKYVSKFEHVLVDEYQDVNLASARLLRAICKASTDVWVVADQRQSIYRFRGAEPSNVSRFNAEFGGARHSLSNNYRSFAPVVRAFERFSATMGGEGVMAGTWTANRANGGEVTLTVAPSLAAEAEAIRDKIEQFREAGVPYSDQAILARTHLTLARLTSVLEQLGVPLLYLGDLFERSEIRDLLSVLALDAEYGNVGLVRVATKQEYGATKDDALKTIKWAHENKAPIFDALNSASKIEGLTANGSSGLVRLGVELQGLENASPWTLLSTWLFERSDYLAPLLKSNDAVAQQKLIAIYQFLKVCGEPTPVGEGKRKDFLARIRRIEVLNQESSYRAVASEASDLDAVRVMTIHGSKGLEFGAIHFPALATRYMPTTRQGTRCPPPSSLAQLAMQSADHDAEEECLFFVGLSRARDYLSLSRAERYKTQNATASKFLGAISSQVTSSRYNGSGITYVAEIALTPQPAKDPYFERELSLYMQCPARYKYEVIDGLHGVRDDSGYMQFHRCVYVTAGWLERQRQAGQPADVAAGLAQLDAEWRARGPVGHPFEAYYRAAAEAMVRAMARAIVNEVGQYDRAEWVVALGAGRVSITPDRVLISPDGAVHVQRIRTGRKTKSEPDNPIYALLRSGAGARYPGKAVSIETFYLATGETVLVAPKNEDKKLKEYADAIAEIETGDFHPEVDPRRCPNCQCYFVCGA
ncbi:MAG TPA: UvrD-helicase domain-containing protein [Candidatus Binatia bacterium]|nr:UvrD-helicase domain-containing protein [Candidatus Binatia bacterium]